MASLIKLSLVILLEILLCGDRLAFADSDGYEERGYENHIRPQRQTVVPSGGLPGPLNISAVEALLVNQVVETQAQIEELHKNDPKDPLELAVKTLAKIFLNFNNKEKKIPLGLIINSLDDNPGKKLFFMVRLLEMVDSNADYWITYEEFANYFAHAMAQPDKMLALMFDIQDYDGDEKIDKYELLYTEILGLGINYNLNDMWRIVQQKSREMDFNGDGVVSLLEYQNYIIYYINKALLAQHSHSD